MLQSRWLSGHSCGLNVIFYPQQQGIQCKRDIKYEFEDREIHLMPPRKKSSKREYDTLGKYEIRYIRKRIKSVFSVIKQKSPRYIHAVTSCGFKLKILISVMSLGIPALKLQVATWLIIRFILYRPRDATPRPLTERKR